jgi:signal transduction histidine kinase
MLVEGTSIQKSKAPQTHELMPPIALSPSVERRASACKTFSWLAFLGHTGTLFMKLPGPLTAEQQRQLNTIQASSGHLLALISDLLDLARIDAGEVQVHLQRTVCLHVIEEVIAALRPRAQPKGLEFGAGSGTSRGLMVNPGRRVLKQILTNLVDTGVGISLEDQPRLLRAFGQIHFGRREQGTGLGLHLCQRLAALVGVRIECESESGKGSRFSVLLPET